MAFNTVVLYDIENLLKGYAFSTQMLSNLSLQEILESVSRTGRLSSIAIQRAYANWSDPRLAVMRGEINEMGIEPVQVFGFSRDQKRNAADIQLAIDAIDIAHVRPSLDVFVIVSGDGGFASLAKKLHEYGKTVVGCAYPSATNRTFQAVCDEFVSIVDPESLPELVHASQATPVGPQITTPLVLRLARTVRPVASDERETVIAKAKEILKWLECDASSRSDLGGRGLHLSVVGEAIRHAVPTFDPTRVGFGKFIEFLQFACADTSLCVLRLLDGSVVLARRSNTRIGAEALPDLGHAYIHSIENYRAVLATGTPVLRLPEHQDIHEVAAWVALVRLRDTDLGVAIETVTDALEGQVSSEATKRALLCFISAGLFDREPPDLPLAEQKLTLKAGAVSGQDIVARLRAAVVDKLQRTLGGTRDEVVAELLPADCA